MLLAAIGPLLLATGPARAAPGPVFTSAYTDLARDCRPVGTAREQKDDAEYGRDTPLSCPGPGGQAVYVSFSAWAASISVGPAGARDERLRPVASQPFGFLDAPGRRLEWRLADGKPFATILRVTDYRAPADGADNPYEAKNARGPKLVVTGLAGFERLSFALDARRGDANAEARRRADAAFRPAR